MRSLRFESLCFPTEQFKSHGLRSDGVLGIESSFFRCHRINAGQDSFRTMSLIGGVHSTPRNWNSVGRLDASSGFQEISTGPEPMPNRNRATIPYLGGREGPQGQTTPPAPPTSRRSTATWPSRERCSRPYFDPRASRKHPDEKGRVTCPRTGGARPHQSLVT